MSLQPRFNRIARAELEEAVDAYEEREAGLGLRLASAVEEAVEQLCQFPEAGPVARGQVRKRVLTTFPYTIFYTIRPDTILVLAMAHQRRQPFYWLGRR